MFTSAVRAPAELTAHLAPFHTEWQPPVVQNPLLSDWSRQFQPWQRQVREAWQQGRVPLWNDRAGCGQPLLAGMQGEALSPYLPLSLLAGDQYPDWKQLAQLLVAQALCLLLAGHLGLAPFSGTLLAVAFSFSSVMQCWSLHPHAGSTAFIPGVLLALLILARRFSTRALAGGAACVGLSVLAGHAETTALLGAGCWLMALLTFRLGGRAWSRLMCFLGVPALGLLLAGALVLPFLEYLGQSDVETVRGLTPKSPLSLAWLATLFDPFARGGPRDPLPADGSNLVEAALFVGRIAIVLAVAGALVMLRQVQRRRLGIALLAVALLGCVTAYAPEELFRWLAGHAPFDRVPLRRLHQFALLPLAIFAAYGLESLARIGRPWVLVVLLAAGGEALLTWHGWCPVQDAAWLRPASPIVNSARRLGGRCLPAGELLPPEVPGLVGLSSLRSYDAIGLRRHVRALFLAGDVYGISWTQRIVGLDPRILDVAGVRSVLTPWPPERAPRSVHSVSVTSERPFRSPVGSLESPLEIVLHVPAGRAADLEHVVVTVKAAGGRAHDGATDLDAPLATLLAGRMPARALRYLRFVAEQPGSTHDLEVRVPPGMGPIEADQIGRDALGPGLLLVKRHAGWFLAERPTVLPQAYRAPRPRRVGGLDEALEQLLAPGFDPRKETLLEGEAPQEAEAAPAPQALPVESPRPEELRVRLDGQAGVVVVAGAWAPGWRAAVDGASTPCLPANVMARAAVVPAGSRELVFTYAPGSFQLGLVASAAGLLLILLLALLPRARRVS